MDKHQTEHCNSIVSLFLVFFIVMMWGALPAAGEIYRWQDKEGNWHFSDSPTSQIQTKGAIETIPSQTTQSSEKKSITVPDANPKSHSGMLWRISTSGQDPSYLLGTIHSEDPRVTQLRPSVVRALDESHRFIMEMKMDTNAFMQFGAAMLLKEDEDLESIVGKTLFSKLTPAMGELGIPEPLLHRMKPWVVMSMLSMPKPKGGLILDMVLYQRATSQGKSTAGLETAEEQLSVFDGLSRKDQIALLKTTIDNLPAQPYIIETLIEAYAADDLQKITTLSEQYNRANETDAAKRFMVQLNDARNQRMIQRMTPYLRQGSSFIAVGALHLGGPKGLLNLLKRHGYTADAVR